MTGRRDILRAIPNKDYKDTIANLLAEGWTAERTGKNHLKLSHPEAGQTVIASGTPSNYRASANLTAQCRRALRFGNSIDPEPSEKPEPPTLLEELREGRHPPKKKRKNKRRWSEAARKARPTFRKEAQVSETAAPECEKENQIEPRETDMTTAIAPAPTKSDVAPKAATAPEPASVTPAPVKPAPKAPAAVAASSAPIQQISGDLLAVAMRMLSGELSTLEITADMVGKTLAMSGEAFLIDQPASALPQAATAPKAKKAAPAAAGCIGEKIQFQQEALSQRILEVFDTFPNELLTLQQVLNLVEDREGRVGRRHREAVRYRLLAMSEAGLIECEKQMIGKRMCYAYRKG